MNYIYPVFEPIFNAWESVTTDKKWKQLTEYPGDWHHKWLSHERYRINDQFRHAHAQFYEEPTLTDFLWDNKWRFTALAFLERLYTVRQAQGFLKTRFQMPDTNSGALNAIRMFGIGGSFRGNLMNVFHTAGVHYHALLYAKNNAPLYIFYSSLFELALYPIDTLRTLYYADVNRQFKSVFDCVTQVVEKGGLEHFYRGAGLKVGYNVIFGLNLMSVANDSSWKYLTFPLWLASYGLLSLKTRTQIAGSPLSFQLPEDSGKILENVVKRETMAGLYRGILPFLVLNMAAAYYLPSILSEEKKKELLREIRDMAPEKGIKVETKHWS